MEINQAKNKVLFLALSAALFFPPAAPAFASKPAEVRSAESGAYRVFYKIGEPQKDDKTGGKFRELSYKAVFQDDWHSVKKRQIEISFVDSEGFYVVRDVVPDKKFAPRGEFYGFVLVPDKDWKRIKGVSVRELKPEKPKPAPVPEPPPAPAKPKKVKNTGPKGVFGKKRITDDDILKALKESGRGKVATETKKKEADDDADAADTADGADTADTADDADNGGKKNPDAPSVSAAVQG